MDRKEDQLLQWFMEKLSGSLSPEDEVLLAETLTDDARLRALWLSWTKEASGLDVPGFLQRVNADAGLAELKPQLTTAPRKRAPLLAAAAIAVLLLASGAWWLWPAKKVLVDKAQISAAIRKSQPSVSLLLASGRSVDLGKASGQVALGNTTLKTGNGVLQYDSRDTATNTLSVPPGSTYKIVLSDGTEVFLNAATSLRFPFRFGGTAREVFLEGEAFFKVVPDPAHPFIVHAAFNHIRVLGTSFEVNTYEAGTVRTALVEGKVGVKSDKGDSITLQPGYASDGLVTGGFSSGAFDQEDELAWMSGVYYFHDMPLTDLARVASRCYGVRIVADGAAFAGRSMTGLLNRDKLGDFLNDLETTAHITYYYSGGSLYLR